MKQLVVKNFDGKSVLLWFLVTNLVYAAMLFITIPKVAAFAGGLELLDMMPTGYDAQYVNSLFGALGEEGRWAYLHIQIAVDLIYPGLFAVSYTLILAYFLEKIHRLEGPLFYLCWLHLFAGAADYMENAGIIIMLKSYPDISNLTVEVTNLFSLIKSGATTAFFITLMIVMFTFGVRVLKQRT